MKGQKTRATFVNPKCKDLPQILPLCWNRKYMIWPSLGLSLDFEICTSAQWGEWTAFTFSLLHGSKISTTLRVREQKKGWEDHWVWGWGGVLEHTVSWKWHSHCNYEHTEIVITCIKHTCTHICIHIPTYFLQTPSIGVWK